MILCRSALRCPTFDLPRAWFAALLSCQTFVNENKVIREWTDPSTFDQLGLTWTAISSAAKEVPLRPGGADEPVEFADRLAYVEAVVKFRLEEGVPQVCGLPTRRAASPDLWLHMVAQRSCTPNGLRPVPPAPPPPLPSFPRPPTDCRNSARYLSSGPRRFDQPADLARARTSRVRVARRRHCHPASLHALQWVVIDGADDGVPLARPRVVHPGAASPLSSVCPCVQHPRAFTWIMCALSLYSFVTGRSRVPPPEEFESNRIEIQRFSRDGRLPPDQYLPLSHTCFNSVEIPQYSSYEVRSYFLCSLTLLHVVFCRYCAQSCFMPSRTALQLMPISRLPAALSKRSKNGMMATDELFVFSVPFCRHHLHRRGAFASCSAYQFPFHFVVFQAHTWDLPRLYSQNLAANSNKRTRACFSNCNHRYFLVMKISLSTPHSFRD